MQLVYPGTVSVVWLCRQQGDDLAEETDSSTAKMGEGHNIGCCILLCAWEELHVWEHWGMQLGYTDLKAVVGCEGKECAEDG